MSTFSLEKAIRTCKVSQDWANRYQSDRTLGQNQEIMTCPVWTADGETGYDNYGRQVGKFTYNNRTAGCNDPEDQIRTENDLRPQYMEYVTLDADGISGDRNRGEQISYKNSKSRDALFKNSYGTPQDTRTNMSKITGFGGQNLGSKVEQNCSRAYDQTSQSNQAQMRFRQAQSQYRGASNRKYSGI